MARYHAIERARLRAKAGSFGAFMDGYVACKDTKPGDTVTCPYPEGKDKMKVWFIGWDTRLDEENANGVNRSRHAETPEEVSGSPEV